MEALHRDYVREFEEMLDESGLKDVSHDDLPPAAKVQGQEKALNAYIDHTLLDRTAGRQAIQELCQQAVDHGFFGVCVNPCHIEVASDALPPSDCTLVSVVGFPLGTTLSETKADEAESLIEKGVDEVDMVIRIDSVKAADFETVYTDIRSVVERVKPAPVKTILETPLLSDQEVIGAALTARHAGAAFVKTSTGFVFEQRGSTYEKLPSQTRHVRLLDEVVGGSIGIKAAGGIRTKETAEEMIEAGATRLGCSKSLKLTNSDS